jgi:hypothetical protein
MAKGRPTTTIELDYSIEVDGVSVDTLTMRRPTVRDQLQFDEGKGNEARRVVKMIASLCDVAPSAIEQLDNSDFIKVSEVMQGFQPTQPEN